MDYENARRLKESLMANSLAEPIVLASALPRAAALVTTSARVTERPGIPFAIGLKGSGGKYRLAIRVQSAHPGVEQAIDYVRKRARGECDVQVVGKVVKQQPWHMRRNRPLRIGGSIGHIRVTAGTLGCFVSERKTGEERVLSNNHVLANENNAATGDLIVQPGRVDGGTKSRDRIGELAHFEHLKRRGNLVDAATASMIENIEYYYNWLESLGGVNGVRSEPLEEGETVYKVGRTTGLTKGRVNAVEIDGLKVGYDIGTLEFDGQIQIEPAGDKPFSLGGDSGSLIVDRYRRAVALLFAGNDVDSTFANPIMQVLDILNVDLVH